MPPAVIRLANNENPYGPGPAALEALMSASGRAHRYPGAVRTRLLETISRTHDVPADHILLSGGSGDVMRAAVRTFTSPARGLITPRPTYEAPMRSAQHIGSPVIRVPLDAGYRHNLKKIVELSPGAGLIYLCNPNNPTGTLTPAAALGRAIDEIVRTSPSTCMLIDEAYLDYADDPAETAIPRALVHQDVIVTRTFSKIHGMAGMRVAYAIGRPETLDRLRVNHSMSSLSSFSAAAAAASLEDRDHLIEMAARNRLVRRAMIADFASAGYQATPSDANFIFVNIRRDAHNFVDACAARRVQIGRAFPPMGTWARIAVGTPEEMSAAMPILKEVLATPPQIRRVEA